MSSDIETVLRILSFGAGIQSTTLLLMSIRGDLPRLHHCIFADTQSEPPAVYSHLQWCKQQCEDVGIPIHTVTAGHLRADAIAFRRNRVSLDRKSGRKGYASIPLFVLNPDGTHGRVRRQCTSEYKIEPIEKFIKRELLGLKPRQRSPQKIVVEQWLGITTDEARRAKAPSGKKRRDKNGVVVPAPIWWKTHAFPLMGIVKFWGLSDGGLFGTPSPIPLQCQWPPPAAQLSMSREHCVKWLNDNYPHIKVPRSACVECPYRTDEEWERMSIEDPASFASACNFDDEIREAESDYQIRPETVAKLKGRLVGKPFVHRSCLPLRKVDFKKTAPPSAVPELDEDGEIIFGQAAEVECEGMCGV